MKLFGCFNTHTDENRFKEEFMNFFTLASQGKERESESGIKNIVIQYHSSLNQNRSSWNENKISTEKFLFPISPKLLFCYKEAEIFGHLVQGTAKQTNNLIAGATIAIIGQQTTGT